MGGGGLSCVEKTKYGKKGERGNGCFRHTGKRCCKTVRVDQTKSGVVVFDMYAWGGTYEFGYDAADHPSFGAGVPL